jgi:hypothetical protein
MTEEQLDALIEYIDAAIDDKASIHVEESLRANQLKDALYDSFKEKCLRCGSVVDQDWEGKACQGGDACPYDHGESV